MLWLLHKSQIETYKFFWRTEDLSDFWKNEEASDWYKNHPILAESCLILVFDY